MAQEPYENEGSVSDYQFTDEHEKVSYQYEEKKRPKFDKRILIVVVAAIVIIFAGYKLVSFLLEAKKSPATSTSKLVPAELTSSAPTAATGLNSTSATTGADTTTANLSAQTLTPVTQSDSVNQALSKLQAQTTALQNLLNNLQTNTQTKLSALQQNVTDLTTQLQSINQAVQTLSQQAQAQQQQAQAEAAAKADAAVQEQAAIRQQKQYIVEAVIPGRAWLKGKDGTAITVAKGDNINGYGQVLAIDSYSGTVTTSSGITIPYGVSPD